jgi:hypothetical protein
MREALTVRVPVSLLRPSYGSTERRAPSSRIYVSPGMLISVAKLPMDIRRIVADKSAIGARDDFIGCVT